MSALVLLTFGMVSALLCFVGYALLRQRSAERHRQSTGGISPADDITSALAAIEDQRRRALDASQCEAARIIEQAQRVAVRVKERELRLALLAAEQIVTEARVAAAQERLRVLDELQREVRQLVTRVTVAATGRAERL
jgi:F0F1-type ATP synthase membrane subunit b/b'